MNRNLLQLLARRISGMPYYNDAQCVAALNSCLDLKKWSEIPAPVQERIKNLFRRHRLGMVCFFAVAGFGLRVYEDGKEFEIKFDGSDMAELSQKPEVAAATIDTEGHWVKCDAILFTEHQEWIVLNENAKLYYRYKTDWDGGKVTVTDEEDEETQAMPDLWTSSRSRSTKFTSREAALAIAEKVKGIIARN